MSVEDPKGQAATPQEVYDRIQNWVEAQPFGSSGYQAISDYMELQRLHKSHSIENQHLLSAGDTAQKLSRERTARITDLEIALLNHQISQSRSRVPGYGKAYDEIEGFFESELFNAAMHDATIQYPGQTEEQYRFIRDKYSDVEDTIDSMLSEKRG